MSGADSPIEAYLDELLAACLPGRLRQTRHLLNETEAHLRDAAAAAEGRGLSAHDAELDAVRRFGSAGALAAAERRVQRVSWGDLVRQCVWSGLLMGGIGGVAVGGSGVIAAVMRSVGGQRFLINPPSGGSLSPGNCARWLAGTPHGTTCVQAGLADWANDIILGRVLAGVVGLVALAAFLVVRRRWSGIGGLRGLPAVVVDTAGTLAFGGAGVWMAGLGIDRVAVSSGYGSGTWLSGAPIALVLGLVFGVRLLRDVRESAAPGVALASA